MRLRARSTKPSLAINILPAGYRRRYVNRRELGLALLLLVVVAVVVISAQRTWGSMQEVSALRAEEGEVVTTTRRLATKVQEAESLRREVSGLTATLAETQRLRDALASQWLDWDKLLFGALVSQPSGIELSWLKADPKRLDIGGVSHGGFTALQRYYDQLSTTPGVSKVNINKTGSLKDAGKADDLGFELTVDLGGR